jgi:hypothetical protein
MMLDPLVSLIVTCSKYIEFVVSICLMTMCLLIYFQTVALIRSKNTVSSIYHLQYNRSLSFNANAQSDDGYMLNVLPTL